MASEKGKVYECRAKGIFRKEKLKPLVGDYVEVEILDPEEKTGNVVKILPRKNQLIRPAVANVDQALVIFAVKEPNPNFMLLDRFLIVMERQDIPAVICFNKEDLGQEEEIKEIAVSGARLVKQLSQEYEGNFLFEYSPESFTGTEPEYAVEVCNAVLDVMQPTPDRPMIINLPVTVEMIPFCRLPDMVLPDRELGRAAAERLREILAR